MRTPVDVLSHPALDQPVEDANPERGVDKVVFGVTAAVSLAFLVWGFVSTDYLATASGSALTWVMEDTGWLFVTTASAFVVFVIWLAASRFGDIPLGRDDEEPEFRTVSWVAMMFSAGMVTVDAALAKFSGIVKCEVLQATSVISTTYTPGAGNIW